MNASPLIGLANLDGLAWLRKLYGRARITPTVRSEVLTGLGRPGETEVAAAIRRRQIGVLRRDPAGPLLSSMAQFHEILANYRQWRQQFVNERGELKAQYRPAPMVASFMPEPSVAQRAAIPVPKGPVEVW